MSRVFTALRTRSKEVCLLEATSAPTRRISCERKDLRPRGGLRGNEGMGRPIPECCEGDSDEREWGRKLYEWGGEDDDGGGLQCASREKDGEVVENTD